MSDMRRCEGMERNMASEALRLVKPLNNYDTDPHLWCSFGIACLKEFHVSKVCKMIGMIDARCDDANQNLLAHQASNQTRRRGFTKSLEQPLSAASSVKCASSP